MTTTLVWTGVALWLGLNAALAARCIYVARPVKVASRSARIIHLDRHRG
ncbi:MULTISPECIES: hypothetical protein [unclassified Bradyrhizobium]|nr:MULTISPECIES: hypothetical protein [unclassified Bradyrhizobium]MCP3465272.1 hypothetical protein [Bradyrhizobium sp. CCGUVB23]